MRRISASLNAGTFKLPPPCAGIGEWPVLGKKKGDAWTLAATNLDAVQRHGPAVLPRGGTVLGKVAAIGADILKFVASVVIAGFLFRPRPRLAAGIRAFASRLITPRGEHFVDLGGATIRNISRGVIGIALLQSLLAGITLYAAEISGARLIAFGLLLLCIVQIGPAPILLPVLTWLWMTHPVTFAFIVTLLLIGMIGGTLSHGLISLVLGPIVLSVFYEFAAARTLLGSGKLRSAPPPEPNDGATPR